MSARNTSALPPLGIFAWFGVPIPFQERMKIIKDAGFEATSVWWEEKDAEKRKLRHLAPDAVRGAGLYLENIHVPYRGCNDLWASDTAKRENAVDRHIGWVNDCARHEIPRMVMHVTTGKRLPPPNDEGVDAVRRLVGAAEDHSVRIALENSRSMQHLEALLARIDSPNLGLCYDVGHDWAWADEPFHLLDAWGNRLLTTHLSDNNGKRDHHWIPGEGTIDFDRLSQSLDWSSYAGVLSLEVVPKDKKEDPEVFLARAYQAACKLRERLLHR